MAPEVIKATSINGYSFGVDMFSLGCIMFYLCSGMKLLEEYYHMGDLVKALKNLTEYSILEKVDCLQLYYSKECLNFMIKLLQPDKKKRMQID